MIESDGPSHPREPHLVHRWLDDVYGHDHERAQPERAAQRLDATPDLPAIDPILACAVGDVTAIERALTADRGWVSRLSPFVCRACGAALGRTPLVAVTHSSLMRLDRFQPGLRRAVDVLLDAGADANLRWRHPAGFDLSALYGAAGLNHDADVTRRLIAAGADPNDGESLYHSTEARHSTCTTLLLDAGAVVEGTNALHHQLDKDDIDGLRLLLAYTRDANDPSSGIGRPLVWAIRRRRSLAHVEALLAAGADPHARTIDGLSAYALARQQGLAEVAARLAAEGAGDTASIEDEFTAACARGDAGEARRIQSAAPDIVSRLSARQLQQLPNLAADGVGSAVRLMVELGWPIAVTGGDWNASALNLTVFRGNAALARFLLEYGATWTERHGFGSDVSGTLAWASRNEPVQRTATEGDWIGCAQALVDHGMPADLPQTYGADVTEFFARLTHPPAATSTPPRD